MSSTGHRHPSAKRAKLTLVCGHSNPVQPKIPQIWVSKQACATMMALPREIQRPVYLALKRLRTDEEADNKTLKAPLSTVKIHRFTLFHMNIRVAYQRQMYQGAYRFVVLALLINDLSD
ncbi:MAG: hypothetical protein VKK59_00355 [Vampirovibrionales bacterium]|nr:hypothetical protein [Vampirovibrionales bacterium]